MNIKNEKNTIGIVRNLDDLGRIVIPKEIRRTLEIKEGCPLEIFMDNEEIRVRKVETVTDWHRTIKHLISRISEVDFHDLCLKADIIDHRDCVDALLTGVSDNELFNNSKEAGSNG